MYFLNYSQGKRTNTPVKPENNQYQGYQYDGLGKTLNDGVRQYQYDNAGRISGITGSSSASYEYNALGQRVRKSVANTDTYFNYDEQGQLIGEYDADGNAVREYVYFGNVPIALLSSEKDNEILQIHTDHPGTPRVVTDKAKNIVWKWEGDAFGSQSPQIEIVKMPLRMAGQYSDNESGLFYNYFRYYDPKSGRYLRSDPLGIYAGFNPYNYVFSNPLRYFDRYGLSAEDVQKIQNEINQTIKDMVDNGHRRPGSDAINGYLNNSQRHWKAFTEDDYKYGIWDQVSYVNEELKKLDELDDNWTFIIIQGFGHATGMTSSHNMSDPRIEYAPWINEVQITERNFCECNQ